MFCPNCGNEVKEEPKFCQYCGSQIAQKQQKHIKIIWICAALFVVLIGISAFASDKNKDQVALNDEQQEVKFEKNEVGDRDVENTEQPNIVEDSVTKPEAEESDVHSIWLDGREFKILKYLDDENMLVKFTLDNYMIQAAIPRDIETQQYAIEYYSESYGEEVESWVKLINFNKEDAVMFSLVRGPETMSMLAERSVELAGQIGTEGVFEVESLRNGKAFVMEEGLEVAWSEYDRDERWLDGYLTFLVDREEQVALIMLRLDADVETINKDIFEHVAFRKMEDDDYVMRFGYWQENCEAMMDNVYQKYREIVKDPTTYLQNNYEEPGDNYIYHYLYDLSGDNVPEMIFMGNPRRTAIVGEKNAISLSCDQIVFSDTPNIFYTSIAFQADVTWDKMELQMDEQGYLVANSIARFGINSDGTCWYNEESITAEEYEKIIGEIKRKDIPQPRMYDATESIASEKGFLRSVQCFTNDFVFEEY